MRKSEFFSKKKSKVFIAVSVFLALFFAFSVGYFLLNLMRCNEAKEKAQEQITLLTKKADSLNEAYENAVRLLNEGKETLASLKAQREEISKRIKKWYQTQQENL